MNVEQVKPMPSYEQGAGDALDLKAERVQEELALKAERVQELLRMGWRLAGGGAALQRVRVFAEAFAAKEYANYVSALASSLWLPVQVRLAGKRCDVILRLSPRQPQAQPRNPRSLEAALIDLAAELG